MSIADVETLTRYIIAAGGKGCALCWKGLPAGTAAFTDPEGFVVCATCALHCAMCNDPEHGHPRYVHADAEAATQSPEDAADADRIIERMKAFIGPDEEL